MDTTYTINTLFIPVYAAAVLAACGAAAAITPTAAKSTDQATAAAATAKTEAVRKIEWDVLLPENERAHFSDEPPPPVHDYLGEGGMAARQAGSIAVNKKLDMAHVKIPGFVVPLDMDSTGLVTEFFLVPFLGACIHVPPPPPNQIVYVKLSKGGVRLGSPEEAYWITGTLHTQMSGTRVAKAAYTLDATRMELYKY
jgi:hypothetical protein